MGMACDALGAGTGSVIASAVGGAVGAASGALATTAAASSVLLPVNDVTNTSGSSNANDQDNDVAIKAEETEGEAVVQPKRSRTKSEETAMILTSMSKGTFGAEAFAVSTKPQDDDDMMMTSADDELPPPKQLRHESNRVKSMVTKHISIDELRAHFDRPIIDVAKDFGICITLMKKICRRNGIKRWPHRQIRSLSKSIASMEAAMLSAQGTEREKYRDQIRNLKLKRESVIADPNKENHLPVRTTSALSVPADSIQPMARAPTSFVLSTPSSCSAQVPPAPASLSTPAGPAPTSLLLATPAPAPAPVVTEASTPDPTTPLTPLPVETKLSEESSSSSSSSSSKGGRWTSEEHAAFLEGIRLYGKDWRRVAQVVMTRSAVQTRTHAQKYLLKFAGRFPFETPAESVIKQEPPSAPFNALLAATTMSSSKEA